MPEDIINFETEMNRGFLQILVLVMLESPMYGYMMLKHLNELQYALEESTLYPLLRRLEKYGLVGSRWEIGKDRPRKFYSISGKGREVRKVLLDIWQQQNNILKKLKKKQEGKNA